MTSMPCRSPQDWATHVARLEQQLEMLNAKVEWYESQLRLAAQRPFGASLERSDPRWLELFNEAEAIATLAPTAAMLSKKHALKIGEPFSPPLLVMPEGDRPFDSMKHNLDGARR